MTTLRISQLAQRVGMKPTTLRFYEQAGLLPAARSESGYRLYDDKAVERLEFIACGKRIGLPLEEIRDLLGVWEDGPCTDVRARLRPMVVARIVDAEQRAAELAAFVDRLRGVLVEVDGPARPGRCDSDCLRPSQPAPVAIACTLTGDDQAERIQQWQGLLAGTTPERIDGGLLIRLPAESAGPAAELAAAEQRCCAFFEFTLRLTGGVLELEVRAPAEAAPLLADVFGCPA